MCCPCLCFGSHTFPPVCHWIPVTGMWLPPDPAPCLSSRGSRCISAPPPQLCLWAYGFMCTSVCSHLPLNHVPMAQCFSNAVAQKLGITRCSLWKLSCVFVALVLFAKEKHGGWIGFSQTCVFLKSVVWGSLHGENCFGTLAVVGLTHFMASCKRSYV